MLLHGFRAFQLLHHSLIVLIHFLLVTLDPRQFFLDSLDAKVVDELLSVLFALLNLRLGLFLSDAIESFCV